MSVKVISKVWDTPCPSHPCKLVLVALADNSNDQHFCYPSIATIAKKCDMSEQGIRGQIRKLEAAGLLTVDRSKGRMSNGYIVLPSTLHGVEGNGNSNPARRGPQPCTPCTPTLHGVQTNRQRTVIEPPRQGELLEPARKNGSGVSASMQAMLDKEALHRVEAAIKRITESVESHEELSPDQKRERKTLRGQADELKRKLNFPV